ncbi:hypothetical protein J7F03_35415 [Streptomyces sp. ISL-43]|uniref:hypothetical protein n=1 Tax=Streptomyces sp. ISL-43 TaxID=2819183 RepID=UPI001BEAA7A7|nr:hypothetical protein [Streptomyces sp. ISL-43]MBT2452258.1 hypothetical protein [Streptomyces sp. ISL-43]
MSSDSTPLGDRAERALQQRHEQRARAALPALPVRREWVHGLVRFVREPGR